MFKEYDYRFIQAVRHFLAEMGVIAIFWDTKDVQNVAAPGLTKDEAWQVLERIEEDLNPERGVSLYVLSDTAHEMFPEVI